eukprot:CAMPEP_0197450164 /NCGR_PEP_ID=MMETSP1175-20131217/24207_1 /TAXON_ID=1003142 /ORGANISM="Triceratium dubium, Strain CCMP147" /LENGTH=98 /DNA_ID=CAMNT_0042982521 /DNA_START=201 /DNA_END=495 /DNA_ORIENTATION=-
MNIVGKAKEGLERPTVRRGSMHAASNAEKKATRPAKNDGGQIERSADAEKLGRRPGHPGGRQERKKYCAKMPLPPAPKPSPYSSRNCGAQATCRAYLG